MHNERTKGVAYSLAFHVLLLLVLIFGLPSILKNEPPPEPMAISIEVVPISEKSNMKNSDAEKSEKPKPEPQDTQKKPSPPVKTSEPTPAPPEPTPAPAPPKPEEKKPEPVKPAPKPEPPKPEIKKPEPPKEVKKPKPKEDSLDAILKAVKKTAQEEAKDQKKQPVEEKTAPTPKAISSRFDPGQQMSMSEKDAIMGQLAKCWNPPGGAKNAQDLVVVIHAEYNVDGSVIKAEIASESIGRFNSDSFFRSAAEAARRAVLQCSPLKNLSPDKYAAWGVMELHFDPRDMLQ